MGKILPEILDDLSKEKRRQQILVENNDANLVVNGEAKLVIRRDYRKAGDQSLGKIVGQGLIYVPKSAKR